MSSEILVIIFAKEMTTLKRVKVKYTFHCLSYYSVVFFAKTTRSCLTKSNSICICFIVVFFFVEQHNRD